MVYVAGCNCSGTLCKRVVTLCNRVVTLLNKVVTLSEYAFCSTIACMRCIHWQLLAYVLCAGAHKVAIAFVDHPVELRASGGGGHQVVRNDILQWLAVAVHIQRTAALLHVHV